MPGGHSLLIHPHAHAVGREPPAPWGWMRQGVVQWHDHVVTYGLAALQVTPSCPAMPDALGLSLSLSWRASLWTAATLCFRVVFAGRFRTMMMLSLCVPRLAHGLAALGLPFPFPCVSSGLRPSGAFLQLVGDNSVHLR